MRKFISTILMISILLPVWFVITAVEIQRYFIKKEIKQSIISVANRNELIKLTFKNSEINQLVKWKDKKEFQFNNQMYDIVELSETIDSTTYYCWKDNAETALNLKLTKFLSRSIEHNSLNANNAKQLSSFYLSLFFNNTKFNYNDLTSAKIEYIINSQFYNSLTISPNYPPPKIG